MFRPPPDGPRCVPHHPERANALVRRPDRTAERTIDTGRPRQAATTASPAPSVTGSATDASSPLSSPLFGATIITPGDSRYLSMLFGDNFRFVGSPGEVRVVSTTAEVVRAVQDAVRAGKWIAPRSGGHCFENFTADPGIRVLLDVSPMDAVGYDPRMNAFLIEPGATGNGPSKLLPPAPAQMYFRLVTWDWSQFTEEQQFTRLLRNFGTWHEQNSAPGSPGTGIYAILNPLHVSAGSFYMVIQADDALPDIDTIATGLVDAVTAGTNTTPSDLKGPAPWLHMVSWPGDGEGGDKLTRRLKLKAAYLRKGYTDAQLSAIYQALNDPKGSTDKGLLLVGYGGQVQAVSPTATALAQRDVVMKAVFQSAWFSADDDAQNVAWMQNFYRSVYAATGGAPVPDAVSHGSYINYPDIDLADPTQNTSGVPWYHLYYAQNYPRLQQSKAKWDPRNVFHHALSIQPPPA